MRISSWSGGASAGLFVSPMRSRLPIVAVLLSVSLCPVLNGCAGPSVGPGLGARSDSYDQRWGVSASARVINDGPVPKGGGSYKLGRPYQVGGRWYVPRHEPYYDRSGVGSWYGKEFHGRKTANGEVYDMDALTAAHPTLPMPSYAYVTNLRNGHTILVRINDRGPYVADREIDLSRASARALGYFDGGLARVRVRWAGHAPLNGDDSRERAFIGSQPWHGGNRVAGGEGRWGNVAPPQSLYGNRRTNTYEDRMRRPADDGRPAAFEAEQLPWKRSTIVTSSAAVRNEADERSPPPFRDRTLPSPRFDRRAEAMLPEQEAPPERLWSPFEHRAARGIRR